jgi:hypothetical protein
VDLTEGESAYLDDLRAYGQFQSAVEDDRLQEGWDGMCDLALEEVQAEYRTDSPPRVREWAYSVASMIVRASTRGGQNTASPDGVTPGGIGSGSFEVRQRRGLLGRQYAAPHVTIAGGP